MLCCSSSRSSPYNTVLAMHCAIEARNVVSLELLHTFAWVLEEFVRLFHQTNIMH